MFCVSIIELYDNNSNKVWHHFTVMRQLYVSHLHDLIDFKIRLFIVIAFIKVSAMSLLSSHIPLW